ncbi:MAG: hypothetical protein ACTHJV_14045 [Rhizobiaceae bacterium]
MTSHSSKPSAYSCLTVAPQIIHDAPLLTIVLSSKPERLHARIPSPLRPHPDGRLILNMWALSDPRQTTGFGAPGPVGVSYLAAEVAGPEGASNDGAVRFPGRVWLEHWSSSEAARAYARAASGLEINAGETEHRVEGDRLTACLRLDGRIVIEARARVGTQKLGLRAGHSVYYGERTAGDGGREVARFDVPWVAEGFPADDPEVAFDFEPNAGATELVDNGAQTVIAVSFRRMTLVPYLASCENQTGIEA